MSLSLSMGLPVCEAKVSHITVQDAGGADSEVTQSVITYLIPVPPEWKADTDAPLQVSAALHTCDSENVDGNTQCKADATPILSLLNFESRTDPTKTCRSAVQQTFAPIDHVAMHIFGKTDGETLSSLQTCSGSDPCVASELWNDAGGEPGVERLFVRCRRRTE